MSLTLEFSMAFLDLLSNNVAQFLAYKNALLTFFYFLFKTQSILLNYLKMWNFHPKTYIFEVLKFEIVPFRSPKNPLNTKIYSTADYVIHHGSFVIFFKLVPIFWAGTRSLKQFRFNFFEQQKSPELALDAKFIPHRIMFCMALILDFVKTGAYFKGKCLDH